MSSIGTIAAQALAYQATVMATAAQNIVNARVAAPTASDGAILGAIYRPRTVIGVPVEGGGVRAEIVSVMPPSHVVFDAASATGYSAVPNVDIAAQMVTLMMASSSYRAAAGLLAVESRLTDALIGAVA